MVADIKKKLMYKILSIKDDNLLEEIYWILETGMEPEGKIDLSIKQKSIIDKGIRDFEEGRFFSNSKANKEIDEWLKK